MAQTKVRFDRAVEGATNIVDSGTEGTKVASGTTGERGSTQGQFRFNTTTGLAEYYDGSSFKAIDSPPEINSISPTSIDESDLTANQTIVITGSNFSTSATVKIVGNDNTEITPASTTRNSATQITITTPTSGMTASNEPYKFKVTNSSGLSKTSGGLLSINDKPVFSVAAGSLGNLVDGSRAASNVTNVNATDEESDSITFAVTSGSISPGLTFNSNGTFSGTANAVSNSTTSTFTVTSSTSATISSGTSCTYGANFSQFNPFVNGTYVARGFKFRCDMDSDDPAQSIEIDQLGYTAELESRTETSLGNAGASSGGFIASGTSQKSVTFTNSFFTGQTGTSVAANSILPSIGITIENAQSGDFFALSSITGNGFNIDIKNGSSHVDREFKYTATGFGRGS